MPSERDALFRAILANPDDDTVRLAFADYLEENGDAKRAAFIREQIELTHLREWDERYVRLLRKRELFQGLTTDPFRPRPPTGLAWEAWDYRRGFVWSVNVNTADDFVAHADAVCALAPVQSLSIADVYHQQAHDLERLSASPVLARLRRLRIISSEVDWQAVARLGNSPHATSLRELDCRLAALRTRAICTLLRSPLFPRLASLQLAGPLNLGASFAETLARLPATNALRSLSLCEVFLEPGANHFVHAPALAGLIDLRMNTVMHTVGSSVALAVTASSLMRHLESLAVVGDTLGGDLVSVLAGNPASANLRRLELSCTHLGAKAVAALAESPHLRNLRVLVLRGTTVGDEGARAVARSPHLAGLLHLDLADGGVGDAGTEALLDSPLAKTVIRLDMTTRQKISRISDPVRQRLKKKLGARVRL